MKKAEEKGVKNVTTNRQQNQEKEFSANTETMYADRESIPDGWEGLDIGPKTIELYAEELRKAKTVIWNGTVGVAEFAAFAEGTNKLAQVLAELDATTIIGGGDTAAAIQKAGVADKMTHVSTGGGASLEFIEGKKLPGIECLLDKQKINSLRRERQYRQNGKSKEYLEYQEHNIEYMTKTENIKRNNR